MNINKITTFTAALSAAALLAGPRAMAQDATPVPQPSVAPAPVAAPSANPSANARRDEFRQRMNEYVKTALKANDDEWAVIQPLLEKVQDLERQSMMGRFGALMGGMGGFGRRQRDGGDQSSANSSASPSGNNNRGNRNASPESQALNTALESDGTSNADIKAKLQALRDARKKSNDDLGQAREDLKKVLTLRQEATLVNMGILE